VRVLALGSQSDREDEHAGAATPLSSKALHATHVAISDMRAFWLYLPATQHVHTLAMVAPTTAEYLPAWQSMQLWDPTVE